MRRKLQSTKPYQIRPNKSLKELQRIAAHLKISQNLKQGKQSFSNFECLSQSGFQLISLQFEYGQISAKKIRALDIEPTPKHPSCKSFVKSNRSFCCHNNGNLYDDANMLEFEINMAYWVNKYCEL